MGIFHSAPKVSSATKVHAGVETAKIYSTTKVAIAGIHGGGYVLVGGIAVYGINTCFTGVSKVINEYRNNDPKINLELSRVDAEKTVAVAQINAKEKCMIEALKKLEKGQAGEIVKSIAGMPSQEPKGADAKPVPATGLDDDKQSTEVDSDSSSPPPSPAPMMVFFGDDLSHPDSDTMSGHEMPTPSSYRAEGTTHHEQ